jgi:hypothetical protein
MCDPDAGGAADSGTSATVPHPGFSGEPERQLALRGWRGLIQPGSTQFPTAASNYFNANDTVLKYASDPVPSLIGDRQVVNIGADDLSDQFLQPLL